MPYTKVVSTNKSNKQQAGLRYNARLVFTGFSMGLADLVPGVSGGTIALLYGIYDELLYSIKVVTGHVPKLLLERKFKAAYQAVPFSFLLPLAAGIFAAIFGMVGVVSYLIEAYPAYIWSLFFGLVLGSAVLVARRVKGWNKNRALLLLAGFVLTFWLVALPVLNTAATPVVLFLAGTVAISAMILPGISGSLILVLIGQYANVLNAVERINLSQIFSFAAGALAGMAAFSRLLSWLLRVHHSGTIAFLIGVMLGSLRKIWPWQTTAEHTLNNYMPELSLGITANVVLFAAGFALVWQLEKLGITEDHEDIQDREFKREVHSQHD